ncbi:MAG: hypothetical protein IPL52_04540 [Flavobacteriales bacterium]|nr:hypothetical protein [Flavobacteriales bacterium]
MHDLLHRSRELLTRVFSTPWPSALVVLFFTYAAWQEIDKHGAWRNGRVFTWDIEGYYHYLPAAIIHRDLRDLGYVAALDSAIHTDDPHVRFGIHTAPATGHDLNKFPCGTAFFELPLFLVAHAYALRHAHYEANGYTLPYQVAVCASTVLFVSLGLWLLRAFLRKHASERDTTLALVAIAFGTNLFYYSTLAAGMSHGYLFFLFAAVLYLTDRWHRRPNARTAALLGLAIGWTLITRPVDGLVVLVPLLWHHKPNGHWRSSFALLRQRPGHAILAAVAIIIACLPQMLYWKHVTGDLIHYSYHDEGFDFLHPHIIDGLFSYKKGWLLYSPLVAFGLAGLALMLFDREARPHAWPVVVFLPVMCYVVFSWMQWWYGGSFGCRPLVSALALLALPLAYLSKRVFQWHWSLGMALVLLVAGGIKLNMFQQDQYRKAIIHWQDQTRDLYWGSFWK